MSVFLAVVLPAWSAAASKAVAGTSGTPKVTRMAGFSVNILSPKKAVLTLPIAVFNLSAEATTASGKNVTTFITWQCSLIQKTAGASDPAITTDPVSTVVNFQIRNFTPGIYVFQVQGTDSFSGESVTQRMVLVIKRQTNSLPVMAVSIQKHTGDVEITETADSTVLRLPVGKAALDSLVMLGTATDDPEDTVSTVWTKQTSVPLSATDYGNGRYAMANVIPGKYTFRYCGTDDRGGSRCAEKTVVVISTRNSPGEPPKPPDIDFQPMRAFSPNDDGTDDVWRVGNISTNSELTVMLVNQHGQMVTQLRPPFQDDEVWDGTQFGKPVPDGAYYFVIRDKFNRDLRKGNFVLIR